MATTTPHVFKAFCDIKLELAARGGITKDRNAPEQIGGYRFRGIDDLDDVLCGLTAKHGLLLVPRVTAHRSEIQIDARGKAQRHVEVDMEIDVISAVDGTSLPHPLRATGEGIDGGDKATGKATSNARKIACFAAFMVPTHGENVEEYAVQVAAPAPVVPSVVIGTPADAKPGPKKTRAPKPDQTEAWAGPANDAPPPDPEAMMARVGEVNTFPLLFAFAKEAEALQESNARGEVFAAIHARVVFLFASAKSAAEVKEGLPLVKALGNPLDLVKAGNEAYVRFRQPQQPSAS